MSCHSAWQIKVDSPTDLACCGMIRRNDKLGHLQYYERNRNVEKVNEQTLSQTKT